MSESADASRKRKGRSPSYPGINLETAVQRARQLYVKERQHPTSVETIASHWGYRSLNGPGAVTLAALKKFGLASYEGSGEGRRAALTDLAVDILENPSILARQAATQRAALSPSIHRELWERYGASPPSDLNLRWELTRDRGFTETGAAEFIPEYRETIDFAQLADSGTALLQDHDDAEDGEEEEEEEAPPPPARQQKEGTGRGKVSETASVYTIPLPRSAGTVRLEADFPLSESDWQHFITVLNAMKPGLVDNGHDD